MIHVDLTSGIGGFALAARWIGWNTVGFCEIDPFCQKILKSHWPEVPLHDDIKTIDAQTVIEWSSGNVPNVLTAGYPCQPFSNAGKRKGEQDPRHLWPYIRKLLFDMQSLKPDWVVFENVYGHVGLGLDSVLKDLEELNYAATPFVVPASSVGALHQRERVWIVGNHSAFSNANCTGFSSCQSSLAFNTERENQSKTLRVCSGSLRQERNTETKPCVLGKNDGISRWMDGPIGAFGTGKELEVECTIGHVKDHKERVSSLGNSIVPQLAYVIFLAISEAQKNDNLQY